MTDKEKQAAIDFGTWYSGMERHKVERAFERYVKENGQKALPIADVVKRGGTISLSWGKYGGFYFGLGYTKRICLGWLAITYFPRDLDDILSDALNMN